MFDNYSTCTFSRQYWNKNVLIIKTLTLWSTQSSPENVHYCRSVTLYSRKLMFFTSAKKHISSWCQIYWCTLLFFFIQRTTYRRYHIVKLPTIVYISSTNVYPRLVWRYQIGIQRHWQYQSDARHDYVFGWTKNGVICCFPMNAAHSLVSRWPCMSVSPNSRYIYLTVVFTKRSTWKRKCDDLG